MMGIPMEDLYEIIVISLFRAINILIVYTSGAQEQLREKIWQISRYVIQLKN